MGHCKFAEMLDFSHELVVVICFVSKTASIISTTATGQSVKSVYAFFHFAFGRRHGLRTLFLSAASTPTTGSNGRVPPPRGSSSPAHFGLPLLRLRPSFLVRLPFCVRILPGLSTGAARRVSRPSSSTSWRTCVARSTGSSLASRGLAPDALSAHLLTPLVGAVTCFARPCARCFVCPTHVLTPGRRRFQTPPGRRRFQTPPGRRRFHTPPGRRRCEF